MSRQMPCGHLCAVSMRHVIIRVTVGSFNGPIAFFEKQIFLQGRKTTFFYKDKRLNETYLHEPLK